MRRSSLLLVLCAAAAHPARAQQSKPDTTTKAPPAIADNSFLVEEAYNQEAGVVQHISTFQRTRDGSWGYTFTQEWPAPSQRHQLSYTVPILRPGAILGTGMGDLALNYRYQALGKDEEPLWFSPRLSVYLPTGDVNKQRGLGGPGVEVMLPVSIALNDAIVTHWDAGVNFTRERTVGGRDYARGVRAAASAIWLMTRTFNLMLESTVGRTESFNVTGKRESQTSVVVSPGMRGAFNFASGLQIVPGIAMPIGVGPSNGQRDVFLYLSFEHPFK